MRLPLNRRAQGADWSLAATEAGTLNLEWPVRKCSLELGTAKVNKVDEKSALLGKMRWHVAEDALNCRMEFDTVLPFGAEFTLIRQMELLDGAMLATCDLRPGRGGRVQNFELEPLTLTGKWVRLRLIRAIGAAEEMIDLGASPDVLFEASSPWLRAQLEDADGFCVEISTGDDLWRWLMPELNGEYRIVKEKDAVVFYRQVLNLLCEDTAELPSRAYRFQWFVAWSDAPARQEKVTCDWCSKVDSPCVKAAATQRMLKKTLRKVQNDVVLAPAPDVVCGDAAHLERPGKGELVHGDTMERFRMYLWGNREVARRGAVLSWACNNGNWAHDQVMSRVPRAEQSVVGGDE